MKILLSGAFNPDFEALPDYLAAALARLGHEVHRFDHRRFLLPGRLRARVAPLDRLDRDRLNARFVATARRLRPDQIVVNQGMVLTRRSIATARELGARCINWFADYPAEFEAGLAAADAYDAFHLSSSYAARRHREAGHRRTGWLPFACDPVEHRPATPGEASSWSGSPARVVFVGSWYPERQILLRFLRGLPAGIWGPGWERAASDPHIAPMLRGPALRPADWRGLFGRADAVVNIHYGAFGPQETSGDLANTRVFEILGCGAHQIVDRQGDVLRLFAEGEHLSAFSSGEELRARVEQAMTDRDRARSIAERGRARVLAAHTYEQRARALLDGTALGFESYPAAFAGLRSGAAPPRLAAGGRA